MRTNSFIEPMLEPLWPGKRPDAVPEDVVVEMDTVVMKKLLKPSHRVSV